MEVQQVPLKCRFCRQMLGKRVINHKSKLPHCSKCDGELDLDAIDRAGDELIKE